MKPPALAAVLSVLLLLHCSECSVAPHSLASTDFIDTPLGVAPHFKLLPLPYSHTALQPAISAVTLQIHHGKHVQAYVDKANALAAEGSAYQGMTLGAAIETATPGPLLNQLLQIWNHAFYFQCMHQPQDLLRCAKSEHTSDDTSDDDTSDDGRPQRRVKAAPSSAPRSCQAAAVVVEGPSAALQELMTASGYTSVEALKTAVLGVADTHFGSGFTWMVVDEGKLRIYNSVNAGNPVKDRSGFPLLGIDIWEHSYYLDYQNRRAAYTSVFWDLVDWSFVNYLYSQYLLGGPIPFLQ